MSAVKTIGVITSGGDAPGMNAAVRAVVRTALANGIKVKGIYKGYNGLLNEEIKDMDAKSVSDTMSKGGTILYTARCLEFVDPEYQKKGAEICRKHGIDGIVVIGGDGSFKGAQKLSNLGINTIAVIRLKTVWKFAMVPLSAVAVQNSLPSTLFASMILMATIKITPPMVGVFCFPLCQVGPSSRIFWPNFSSRSFLMMPGAMRTATTKASPAVCNR